MVSANTITKVSATGNLIQITRQDPAGAPQIATTTDPNTLDVEQNVSRFSPSEVRIVFDEPIDTSTIDGSTISVTDSATDTVITDLTFGFFRQIAPDGSTQEKCCRYSATATLAEPRACISHLPADSSPLPLPM